MDGLANAVVRAAAADVGDLGVDLGIRGVGALLEKGQHAHNHSGLAVAALRHVELFPCELNRVVALGRESLDGRDRLPDRRCCGDAAGTNRLSVHMHGARTALSDAAAELGARQPDLVTDYPEQWGLWVRLNGIGSSVHFEIKRHTVPPNVRLSVVDPLSHFRAATSSGSLILLPQICAGLHISC